MADQTVKTSSQHKQNEKVTHAGNVNACHELPCKQHTDDDRTCMIYDMANPVHKRKCNIPDFIHWNKNNFIDYKNCMQQNGRHFGFLPLNDLMVYTGEDVIWIDAHKIIRKSAMPNFMGARIPVDGQFNIPTWKSYLAWYWDKQIVDLLQ